MRWLSFIFILVTLVLSKTFIFKAINFDKNYTLEVNKKGIKLIGSKKPLLVVFWGKNCPPCLAEIPELIKIQKSGKVNILAFQVQMPMSLREKEFFFKEQNINYPVFDSANKKVIDFAYYISDLTGWQLMLPFSLYFDKNGKYIRYFLGMVNSECILKNKC